MKNKYYKSTQGLEAQVFVGKAVAYATSATYGAWVTAAVEGEIGVFIIYKASGPTTYTHQTAIINPSDTALAAGDKFFIAQLRDGVIHKTPVMTYSECVVRAVAYLAPVLQVSNLGYGSLSATTGSMNSGTFINGQIFPIKLIENTPGSQPFPTWNYEETSRQGDTLLSVGARLLKQINDPTAAQNNYNGKLVNANLLTNGTFTVNTVGSGNVGVTLGSTTVTATGHNVTAGTYVRIGGTTAAFPIYKVASVSTNAFELESAYTGATNAALSIANLGTMSVVTEIGFKFTAINYNSSFKIAVQEDLVSADIVYTTPLKVGVGSSDQVLQIELEGMVFAGYTTLNEAFTADYGFPASFTVSGTTYQFIYLDYLRTLPSVAAPKISDGNYGHIILALPVGVAPTSDLDGMFV